MIPNYHCSIYMKSEGLPQGTQSICLSQASPDQRLHQSTQ